MTTAPKLVLIDAHALIHRAYHALPPMSTRDGLPTNAAYGFTAMLLRVFTTIKPTHVVAAFDLPGKTFRHDAFADYKAHRKPADPDLITQFAVVREVVQAFNIPIVERAGFEADDIIGTLTRQFPVDIQKIIVTGDMDALQLIDETTTVFTLKRGVTDTVLYDVAAVRAKFGFGPEHVTDYKGLRGDPSDNIPGVAGIGEKTAQTLVARWGTIEAIYEHFDEVPPRMQTKLRDQQAAALASRELATIHCTVPLEFTLAEAELGDYDPAAVEQVFKKLEFKTFLNKLPKSTRGGQMSLGALPAEPVVRLMPDNYRLVESEADQVALRALLQQQPLIAFDTETDGLGPRQHPIVGMSFAAPIDGQLQAWYVPLSPAQTAQWRELLENPSVQKIGHNLKYDLQVMRQSNISVSPLAFDSMVASYLLHAETHQHNMDALAAAELGVTTIHLDELIGKGKTQRRVSEVPLSDLAIYAAEDAEVTFKLYEALAPKIATEKLERVLHELELPLIPVLTEMELTGIRVDRAVLKELDLKITARVAELTRDIWQAAGEEFNINSTLQLRRILYEKLALPTTDIVRTQTGFSTAAAELEKLRGQHAVIDLLTEYRELTKLKNTYIDALPQLIDRETQRIYTSFNQVVAATGRLSSSDPNLQNIPVRTEMGQAIRAAFVADAGQVLIKADYSQLELRLAAHLAQDEKMLAAFRAGQDIHQATAAWVFGIAPNEVKPEQRRLAKTLNFGVLYGMGPKKFAATAGVSAEEARSFIGRYRDQYQGISRMVEATVAHAEMLGYVETLFGRRRYLPEIKARSPRIRAQAERIAFNFPIQGTEADILKKAMIELHAFLQHELPAAKLILTVHDELVCEAPEQLAPQVAHAMRTIMSGVITLDVPLDVDVAIGPNWRDTEPVGV